MNNIPEKKEGNTMNDSPEKKEDNARRRILIANVDYWPECYCHGFDAPMEVIWRILFDSQAQHLPLSWSKVLSGWTNAAKLLHCLESIDDLSDAYTLFSAIDGCSVVHESCNGDLTGTRKCCVSVFVQANKLQQALETVMRLSDALKTYWISSGKAGAVEEFVRFSDMSKKYLFSEGKAAAIKEFYRGH